MRVRRPMAVLALAVELVLFGATAPAWAIDSDGDGVDDAIDVCNNTPPGTAVDAEGRPLGDIDLDCDTDLDDYALFQQGFTGPLPTVIVTVPTVHIGNPGNAGEWSGGGWGGYGPDRICGAVDYAYNIGKFEVTAGQYTAFLNAVATTDTYALYNATMWSNSYGCKIEQTGSPPNFSYTVAQDWASRPVNYISWGDAARFANWLHNGQPTGTQDLTTTEDGSYYLNGATSDAALIAVVREPDATWVVPSEDEWYKAAYHYNDGVTGNYFDYATSSDSVPDYIGDGESITNPDPGNYATYDGDGGIDGIGAPYYRTEAGEHENSDSPYGTFDQSGNVVEWNEAILNGSYRGIRGGTYSGVAGYLPAAGRGSTSVPTIAYSITGFRVAEVP